MFTGIRRNTKKRRVNGALILVCLFALGWRSVAAETSPTDGVQGHIDRLIMRYERGDLSGAISELNKALRLRPEDPHLHFMMGNALYRVGDLKAAAASYAETLKRSPKHFECRMSRGFALYELGELKDAVAEWSTAVRINPQEPFARAALAIGLEHAGDKEEAVNQYERAVIDPRYAHPESLRIDIRWKGKAVDGASRLVRALNEK